MAIYPLAGLAGLAMEREDPWTTARLIGMIEAVWHETGAGSATPRLEKWQHVADCAQRQALAFLGEEQYANRVASGRTLPVTAAIAEGMSIAGAIIAGDPVHPPEATDTSSAFEPSVQQPVAKLSRRENEVLRLLLQRWTAPEMAERMSFSERTIETHVASIYNKLGANSRREAVTIAVSHGLVPDRPIHAN